MNVWEISFLVFAVVSLAAAIIIPLKMKMPEKSKE